MRYGKVDSVLRYPVETDMGSAWQGLPDRARDKYEEMGGGVEKCRVSWLDEMREAHGRGRYSLQMTGWLVYGRRGQGKMA